MTRQFGVQYSAILNCTYSLQSVHIPTTNQQTILTTNRQAIHKHDNAWQQATCRKSFKVSKVKKPLKLLRNWKTAITCYIMGDIESTVTR